jgi:uncharacterized protein DUF4154
MWFCKAPFIRFYTGSFGCRLGLAGLAGLCLIAGCATRPRNPVITEERAAYVASLGEFVEWPAGTYTDSKAPFVIGIYGPGAIDGTLPSLAPGRRINGREAVIRPLQSETEIPQCQILFVNDLQPNLLPGIVTRLKNASVLTVSEDLSHFGESGMMINLFEVDGKMLFEINRDAASRAGLKISSKLLDLAQPWPK